ncbi:RAI1-domain-containing protein [Ascodesmis nigricans]|uniref:Decapping nuclease n=1 Tax=Ascodesmis nigricans TaxID=341454 RepID=A0A4S2MWM0_9PEZI|nr:RAI1-domain-containing protein [Ascodesmis nigricans]
MATSQFPLHPQSRYANLNSAIRQPTEFTCFSYDNTRRYHSDDSSLRYYYTPHLPADLNRGFDEFEKHDDTIDEHLDGLLRALEEYERTTGEIVKADVVTWRGMLTKIMSLPFDLRNSFEMNATRFQDTIFIEEHHPFKMSSQRPLDRRGKLMSFWGYKFETLATLSQTWDDTPRSVIEGRGNEVVNNEAQFCSIVKTGFADVKVVIAGEVDAIWDERRPDSPTPHNYVELKTSKRPTSERDDINFERKLQRIWAQSFLLGVPRVMVGFRDNDGTLLSVEEFFTRDIPKIAKRSGRNLWDGKYSIDFTTALLQWLKAAIPSVEETEGVVWRIRYREGMPGVEVERTDEKSFLTQSFIDWRKSGGT